MLVELETNLTGEEAARWGKEPKLKEILELGLSRLEAQTSWKVWEWQAGGTQYPDGHSFRSKSTPLPTLSSFQSLSSSGAFDMSLGSTVAS